MDSFPFAGVGGLVAVTVLVGGYALFAGLIRLVGATASGLRLSVVPGIVDGIRDWAEREPAGDAVATPAPDAPWEDCLPEPVRRP
jgi:hypothetical protein